MLLSTARRHTMLMSAMVIALTSQNAPRDRTLLSGSRHVMHILCIGQHEAAGVHGQILTRSRLRISCKANDGWDRGTPGAQVASAASRAGRPSLRMQRIRCPTAGPPSAPAPCPTGTRPASRLTPPATWRCDPKTPCFLLLSPGNSAHLCHPAHTEPAIAFWHLQEG